MVRAWVISWGADILEILGLLIAISTPPIHHRSTPRYLRVAEDEWRLVGDPETLAERVQSRIGNDWRMDAEFQIRMDITCDNEYN